MARTQQPTHKLTSVNLIVALLIASFLLLSVLTFSPADPPSTKAWPRPIAVQNACGTVGAWMAYQMFHWIGQGVYPLLILIAVLAGMALANRPMRDWPLRLIGVLFVTLAFATTVRMVHPGSGQSLPEGNGGILGIALGNVMQHHFASLGSAVILMCATLVGLLLAVDELVLMVPSVVATTLRRTIADATPKPARSRARTKPREPGLIARLLNLAYAPGKAASVKLSQRSTATATLEPETETDPEPEENTEPVLPDEPVMVNTGQSRLLAAQIEQQMADADLDVDPDAPAIEDEDEEEVEYEYVDEEVDDDDPDVLDEDDDEQEEEEEEEEDDEELDDQDEEDEEEQEDDDDIPVNERQPRDGWSGATPPPLTDYDLPPVTLLEPPEFVTTDNQETLVREKARLLERTLHDFRIQAKVVQIDTGPVVTMYELLLAPGIKVSQIHSLTNDMARVLKAPAVRVVAPIPGKNTVGLEVPNIDKEKVRLRELVTLGSPKAARMDLPLFLGKDASGEPLVVDLATMPHLLIAGTTGSGKSVCINTLVMSVLMSRPPDQVQLILVDPKMVELNQFRDIPHLMCPIVTDMTQAEMILDWAATKMDERYALLAEAGVRNLQGFNRLTKDELYERFRAESDEEKATIPTHLPHIVIVIDELADLMMTAAKEVEHHLSRLAQKSRAVGIHIVVATQRPQANIVTGLIKSNIPCRIAFRVSSRMDSRIVLDQNGAEVLMGQGDMLFLPPGTSKLVRAQGTYIEDAEFRRVLGHLKEAAKQQFHTELIRLRQPVGDTGPRDELFDQAAEILLETRRGSVSLLQRKLTVGYARASRLIDQLAAAGVVGPYKGSQAREVVMTLDEWEELKAAGDV